MTEIMDVLAVMAVGLWLFLPAYVPNSNAALIGKRWGKVKMDFGKTWKGKRIFGDGKSWAGFIWGILTGVLLGVIQIAVAYPFDPDNYFGFGPFWSNIGVLFCLSTGALLGDLCGAFIKRRIGMERGQKAPILDQYDFVAGAFLLTTLFYPDFVYANYIEGIHIWALVFILLITFVIHRGVNIIGYKLGVKNEPW